MFLKNEAKASMAQLRLSSSLDPRISQESPRDTVVGSGQGESVCAPMNPGVCDSEKLPK